jgi:hypothetical protein
LSIYLLRFLESAQVHPLVGRRLTAAGPYG